MRSRAAKLVFAMLASSMPVVAQHASAQSYGANAPNANAMNAQARGSLAPGQADLEAMVARLDREEKDAQAELDTIAPKLAVIHARMIARGRVYYRYVRTGLLPAGGGFDALVDHAARVERTRMLIERDVADEAKLGKRSVELSKLLERVRAEKAPLAAQHEAMVRARTVLAEADERRAAFARAFETSARPSMSMAIYGADVGPSSDDIAASQSGFRAMKGHLRFPVAGRAEVHRVAHRGASGGPGIELHAALGSAVRSVAAGRVAFADRYDDYGLTVILDHGDHYYSVYANLGSADVKVGDAVPGGGKIGAVGSEGDRPPMLYLEIRHKTDTLEASPWLGI